MNQKHQTCLSQFSCQGQTFHGPKFRGEGFLEVDLAATPCEAGYPFGDNRRENPVSGPSLVQLFRTNKRVILVVGMTDVAGRLRNAQSVMLRKPLGQNRRIPAPDLHHPGKLTKQGPSERRLKFRQAPVGPKRFMKPAKTWRVLAIVDRRVALAVVLIAPGLLPDGFLIGRDHAAFPSSGHDLVLTEGKGTYVAKRAYGSPFVSGSVTLRTILDHLQSPLAG